MRLGLDIGSTTIKTVVLSDGGEILFSDYGRHRSNIREKLRDILFAVESEFGTGEFDVAVSGSAGMGLAERLDLPFVQEVFAVRKCSLAFYPDADAIIELGGEDAKMVFLTGGEECRMNGSCAGGTGAFIDQMAELLNTDSDGMEALAEKAERTYVIASRCGVFAKSDIQPLLNQGASANDIALSVFHAVVNQTVSGLAQGRRAGGKVLYLGGPLHFFPSLAKAFDETLGLKGIVPDNSLFYVAVGAALSGNIKRTSVRRLLSDMDRSVPCDGAMRLKPLFSGKEEYERFVERHSHDSDSVCFVAETDVHDAYLGIDAGSTTVKAVLVDGQKNILDSFYADAKGNSLGAVRDYVIGLYAKYPDLRILSSAVTGYGEELIKNALHADYGIVETVAHFMAARHFVDDVDFIIDIGGQDIKCFRVHGGAIDSLFLNEACSSGCGSFLSVFAATMGYTAREFAELALKSVAPCDLGSRCTVFMNSSVKQAQKDGAGIEDIAAGLSVSVVKNAIYKVIRTSPGKLGDHIVVQGGTFLSDAVLRAFEQETGRNCVRPNIAGLMGCYGAALYAMKRHAVDRRPSSFMTKGEVADFAFTSKSVNCGGCTNSCHLTVNSFSDGGKYIAGNKCVRPLGRKAETRYDIYDYKKSLLSGYFGKKSGGDKPVVGIPLGLNMYELLPFWHTLFTSLDFDVVCSGESTRDTYVLGQYSVPSDTVCYPAKLMHGCVEKLKGMGADMIFYPSMTYNVDEGCGDNHYNCPIVGYYPQVIAMNMEFGRGRFVNPFVDMSVGRKFAKYFGKSMRNCGIDISADRLGAAVCKAYLEYDAYLGKIRAKTDELLAVAKERRMPVILLAGRPYHIDSEVNHGIDSLVCDLGAAVISEDGVSGRMPKDRRNVLDQWTYHSRLYSAARFVAACRDVNINLVQLISFGCGIDAVTSDEIRGILESAGKIYTSIKIDEIANLGAAKIRLRSLFAVL